MYKLQPAPERRYVFSPSTKIAAGARDLSRRNLSTAQTRPQNSRASFAHQHPCGLKSALLRSGSGKFDVRCWTLDVPLSSICKLRSPCSLLPALCPLLPASCPQKADRPHPEVTNG